MQEPVAITGVGVWSCFGRGVEPLAAALLETRSGVRRAAELAAIDDAWLTSDRVTSIERPARTSTADWQCALAVETGHAAWTDAGLATGTHGDRTAIVVGSSHDASDLLSDYFAQRDRGTIDPPDFVETSAAPARELARRLRTRGPNIAISSGCSSALQAIGHAMDMLHARRVDRALVGAYDALTSYTLAGFNNLRLLDPHGPRPFARGARGLVLGDGAAMFVLERAEDATARGARVWAHITGYGCATEIRGGAVFDPNGTRALAAMRAALATDPDPAALQLVCAHATGVAAADGAELAALAALVAEIEPRGPAYVTSIKGSVGDPLAASGGLEVAAVLAYMRAGVIPPIRDLVDPLVSSDPRVRLVDSTVTGPIALALCNSFGFGGSLASVALRSGANEPVKGT